MAEIPAWAVNGLHFENHYIGATFPGITDFPADLALEAKEHNSKVIGSDIVLTDADKARLAYLSEHVVQLWVDYRDFKPLPVLPSELWYFSPPLPGDLPVFGITGGGSGIGSLCRGVAAFSAGRESATGSADLSSWQQKADQGQSLFLCQCE